MVKLEPQHENIPDDILVKAKRFGDESVISQEYRRHISYQGKGGIYLFEALTTDDICRVKILDLTAQFLFRNSNVDAENKRLYPNMTSLGYLGSWSNSTYETDFDYYGNVDWKGFDEKVLCWKGVNTRHFEVDTSKKIDRYMVFDEEIDGTPPQTFYTPFGSNVYENAEIALTIKNGGEVIYGTEPPELTLPSSTEPKVLGCAYFENEIICIVGMNYRGLTNPEGTSGGFYDEVYLNAQRIGFNKSSRPKANWFFNQSGTEAQCVTYGKVKKLTVTKKDIDGVITYTCEFTEKDACSGSLSESVTTTENRFDPYGEETPPVVWNVYDPSAYSVTNGAKVGGEATTTITVNRTNKCVAAVDYKGDTEVVRFAEYSLSDKSTSFNSFYGLVGWIKDIYAVAPDTLIGYSTTECIEVGTMPVVSGGCSPYKITFSKGTCVESTGEILTISCVSGSIAKGGWTITDAQGTVFVTDEYFLPGGTWVTNGAVIYCSGGPYAYFSPCGFGGTYGGPGQAGYSVYKLLATAGGNPTCKIAGPNEGSVFEAGPTTNPCTGYPDLIEVSMASCSENKYIYTTQNNKYVCP